MGTALHKRIQSQLLPFSTASTDPRTLDQISLLTLWRRQLDLSIIQHHSCPKTPSAAGGILEQAWVLKMAGEIARRAHDEKAAREGFWSQPQNDREDTPPPAYEAKAQ